jgi:CO dehydrogenase/acetyl-CoA synthase delta subunit
MDLVGACVAPFCFGGSTTVDAALEFMSKAAPEAEFSRIAEATKSLAMGYDHFPGARDFLEGLAEACSKGKE